ncbi:MAG: phosphate signaling complex protein PhoU [Mycobacteriales bacterium]|jgi:phosphate transport system protein
MRAEFHDELDQIGQSLIELTNLAGSAIARATTALLDADLDLAESVISNDKAIDELRARTDEKAVEVLALQAPVATDLRIVVTSLRMASDLERMGDLASHIARIARMRHPQVAVPQSIRPIILEMGQTAQRIVSKAGSVIASQDAAAASELEADDDVMDGLHRRLFKALLSPTWDSGMEAAIDITLLGRYYERFADHAVSVARRVVYLATGDWPEHTR